MTDITELVKRLSICAKEGNYPALSPTDCAMLVEAMEKAQALTLENEEMRKIIDAVTDLDNEPQYHEQGMGCGIEDRGYQRDGYRACQYGWDAAMERIYSEVIPCAEELSFPATTATVAQIKADAVKGIYSFNEVDCCVFLDGDVCMLIDAYEASLRVDK